jgi:hypothetical protein
MQPAISADDTTGSMRFQTEAPAQSFLELLDVADYEKHDIVKKRKNKSQKRGKEYAT